MQHPLRILFALATIALLAGCTSPEADSDQAPDAPDSPLTDVDASQPSDPAAAEPKVRTFTGTILGVGVENPGIPEGTECFAVGQYSLEHKFLVPVGTASLTLDLTWDQPFHQMFLVVYPPDGPNYRVHGPDALASQVSHVVDAPAYGGWGIQACLKGVSQGVAYTITTTAA